MSADVGHLLKVLGEPLRWDIVQRLAAEELCTCHLVADTGAAQPLVSHHLRVLRQAGIVRPDRVGAFTYYVLDRSVVAALADALGDLAAAPVDTDTQTRRRHCS